MLRLENIFVSYDDAEVLKDVSLTVEKGEIVVILGPNFSGKTTLMNTIAGLLQPKKGQILFNNKRIDGLDPADIVSLGIGLVPEGRHIFTYLSVLENLELGAYTKRAKEKKRETLEWVFQLFPVLKERKRQLAVTLSGGEQQMLAIARALMARPTLLLLDEPSLGLAPLIVQKIFKILERINEEGVTILLVEQNVNEALRIANRGYVLELGKIVLEGTREELINDERIKKSYLGM